MAYSDLLKHPKWQQKRLEILQRDGWQCRACGTKEKTLHVHHFKYQTGKKPWEYPDTNLMTLCCDCHAEEELYIKNQNTGFIKLSRYADFPIRKMWFAGMVLAFLHKYHKDDYKEVCEFISWKMTKNLQSYDEFCEKYE